MPQRLWTVRHELGMSAHSDEKYARAVEAAENICDEPGEAASAAFGMRALPSALPSFVSPQTLPQT